MYIYIQKLKSQKLDVLELLLNKNMQYICIEVLRKYI